MNGHNKPVSRSKVELLAPVGSWESLEAAIQGGADAVYFGVGNLNMRAKSTGNFQAEDLASLAGRCRAAGVRAFLTINTVLFDADLAEMRILVDTARSTGIDAIIASDIAVLEYCQALGVPVHISTQLNVTNIEAVRFYAAWADVMVLARELTLDQVACISSQIEEQDICGPSGRLVRLEIFAHGALCMATSGKCYLSLHEYNLSANRGSCVQICRRAYEVRDRDSEDRLAIENEYIMSPKDLCTIHFLNRILDAGVTVLKIEGRARSPEYVKTVCSVYNEALCSIEAGRYAADSSPDSPVLHEWKKRLSMVFNRGFWDGYYLGQRLGEWSSVYGSEATMVKTYVGKVVNYYAKTGVVEVYVENDGLAVGDSLLFIGPTTGVLELIQPEMQIDGIPAGSVPRGQTVTFCVSQRIRRADKLYKLVPR